MHAAHVALLTLLAMLAFAGNSLLCRLALQDGAIDAASFTTIRLVSGALALWLIVAVRQRDRTRLGGVGNWGSALALFAYAACFSYAYLSLTAATGALLLFGAVQATMLTYGWWRGERLTKPQLAGLVLALAGLVGLLLPGLAAPPLFGALLMLAAGFAWGVYSLRAKGGGDPTAVTAGNFLRTVPFALSLITIGIPWAVFDTAGAIYAVLSGVLASGVGYAIWYAALPGMRPSSAATVQLSVPLLAAAGGVLLLGESITLRLVLAGVAILGGIALVIRARTPAP
jgi:drug/metabolite transporter (DMT)-like permease